MMYYDFIFEADLPEKNELLERFYWLLGCKRISTLTTDNECDAEIVRCLHKLKIIHNELPFKLRWKEVCKISCKDLITILDIIRIYNSEDRLSLLKKIQLVVTYNADEALIIEEYGERQSRKFAAILWSVIILPN